MAARLPKTKKENKNVRVVSSNRTGFEILVELELGFVFKRLVQLQFIVTEGGVNLLRNSRGNVEDGFTIYLRGLRPPQENCLEKNTKLLHCLIL
jgi:hypothetical protein